MDSELDTTGRRFSLSFLCDSELMPSGMQYLFSFPNLADTLYRFGIQWQHELYGIVSICCDSGSLGMGGLVCHIYVTFSGVPGKPLTEVVATVSVPAAVEEQGACIELLTQLIVEKIESRTRVGDNVLPLSANV